MTGRVGRNLLVADSDQPQIREGRNLLAEPEQESFGTSLKMAVPRMYVDLVNNAYQGLQQIPSYIQAGKTEIPGLYHLMMQPNTQEQTGIGQLVKYALTGAPLHGGETGRQALAGLAEQGQALLDLPQNVANYAANRLNLLPQNINQYIQKMKLPGAAPAQESIDQYFGEPKEPGQKLIRGAARNIESILPTSSILRTANPLRLTASNIAKSVVNEGDRQIGLHNRMYRGLWQDADRAGINQVPHDLNLLQRDFNVISRYKTPKEYKSIVEFSRDPTLPNAQNALSDIRSMRRSLEEKSRTNSLTTEERNLYNSLESSENHIESNMFKDKNGKVNTRLQNKYKDITNSYRENVVPYRYNKDIQAFKNKELTPKELAERLKKGEFAAKKGAAHPELFRPDQLKTLLKATALGGTAIGGLAAGSAGIDYLTGLQQQPE